MSPDYEKKLEERVHQELARLPERPAPEALVANVFAAIKAREARPWWKRPIPEWPRGNQTVFVALMLAVVMGAMFNIGKVWPAETLQEIPTQAAAVIEPVKPAFTLVETLTRAAALAARSLSSPWLIGLAVAFMFVYLSCIGMGMAWYRVTFQKPAFKLSAA